MPKRSFIYLLVSLIIFFLNLPVMAVSSAKPHVLLVLCDCLKLDDLHSFPYLSDLTDRSAIGLMNCAIAGPKNGLSAMLTIASGRQSASESTDAIAANDWEIIPEENAPASEIFERRTGQITSSLQMPLIPEVLPVRHLGIASLIRRDFADNLLGAVLQRGIPPVSTAIFGSADTDILERGAALLTINSAGISSGYTAPSRRFRAAPYQKADDPITLASLIEKCSSDLIVVQFGDLSRIESVRNHLTEGVYRELRDDALRRLDTFLQLIAINSQKSGRDFDLFLISSRPPADDARHPQSWNLLPPMLAAGPDFPAGLLTSATTRTDGLAANIDIAPTILSLFHISVPESMNGRRMQILSSFSSPQTRLHALNTLEDISFLNGTGAAKLMILIGVLCFIGIVLCLLFHHHGGAKAVRNLRSVFVFTQCLPAALLLAPWPVPHHLNEYAYRILGWMFLMCALASVLESISRISAVFSVSFLTTAIVLIDTFCGQNLVKNSMLSLYPISGIRYYGIGNEYLGVLLAFAFFGGTAWLDDRKIPGSLPEISGKSNLLKGPAEFKVLFLIWILLAFILGWPGLGANAGSLAATVTAIGVGGVVCTGRKPGWLAAIISIIAGIGIAFLFAWLDSWYALKNGTESSHLGAAIQSASGHRGLSYLLEIITRKVMMNYRLLFSPMLLLAMFGVILTLLAARALLGDSIRSMFISRPWTAKGLQISLFTAIAALLFKDSGIVTITFFGGGICVILLYCTVSET